ncbi:hypothetical protein BJF78_21415 [Pseudonocardia sp. CNS-139]|nr:hypothetical protein BJF78_21415 [Pseudonocardia sp. CNS-139]
MPRTGRRRQALVLAGTLLLASGATAGITAWVFAADSTVGVSEGLRTGGLAGASIVALYALWLNDRRRRVEEDRQHVEEQRLSTESRRIVDERFAKAVELLGNGADQVRVGAMHALVGVTNSAPDYTQTVIDVLCAYLRRPFFHAAYAQTGQDPDRSEAAGPGRGRLTEEEAADDRERQVRLTAQRLVRQLLPLRNAGADGPLYHLDLTGAALEYLDLRDRRVGSVLARRATFYGITRLGGTEIPGTAMFTGAVFRGRVELAGTRFGGGLSLLNAEFEGPVEMAGTVVEVFADLRWLEPAAVDLTGLTFGPDVRTRLPGTAVAPVE